MYNLYGNKLKTGLQLILFLFFLTIIKPSSSQIIIDGDEISGVWEAGSIYIIKNDVEVPEGKTLKIEEGVTVKLFAGVRITVRGNLIAIGTTNGIIRFIPDNVNSYWNNISFKSSSQPILKYCLFEGTEKGDIRLDDYSDLFGALNFSSNSGINSITDCTFRNNTAGAIYVSGSTVERNMHFENLKIISGDNFGIVFRGGSYDSLTFINNDIEGNISTLLGFTGIRIEKTRTNNITLKDNRFNKGVYRFNEHFGGALIIESPEVSEINHVSIENDLYEDSEGKKAAVYIKARTIKIENSIIKNNFAAEGGGCYLIGDSIVIESTGFSGNNVINNTSVFSGGGGLAIEIENPESQITISNSEFTNNSIYNYNGGGLRINGNKSNLSNLIVQNSTFSNNISNLNGGGIGISNFNLVDKIHLNTNSFDTNLAKGVQGGSGVWIDSVKVISSFAIQASKKIKDHKTEFGNGGFLSINNGVEELSEFKYVDNIHSGYAEAVGIAGDGGLVYLNANKISDVYFNENIGISGTASNSGGLVFCKNSNSINSIFIKDNQILVSKAKKGEGGGFAFGCLDFNNFEFMGNTVDSTLAGTDGGLLCFNHNSSPNGIFQISDNIITQVAESGNDGGSYYLNGAGEIKNLNFLSNTINTSKASGDGGALFANFEEAQAIIVNDNKITDSSSGAKGGSYYLNGTGDIKDLSFLRNTIKTSKASGDGGVLFANFGKAQGIYIKDNKITNSSSEDKGGSFYFNCSDELGIFHIKRNTVINSESDNEGGTIYFNGNLLEKNSTVEIIDNTINSTTSAKSKGGLLYLSGTIKQNILFSINTIGTSSSLSDGGLIYCFPKSLDTEKITFSNNTITGSSQSVNGAGGLLYGDGNVELIEFTENNSFNKLSASGSGGGVYWKNSGILSVDVIQNTVKESKSVNGSGGFIYIESEGMNSITVNSNNFTKLWSSLSGGGFLFKSTGNIEDIIITTNTVNNAIAEKESGGFFNVISPSLIQKFEAISNQFEGGIFSAAQNGGIFALNANSILATTLSSNIVVGAVKARNGGGLYINAKLPLNAGKLTIAQNSVKANIEVSNKGGFIYYTGKNDQDFIFNENTFSKLLQVGNAGGMVYIENKKGTSDEIRIMNNSFIPESNNDELLVNTGGVIHYEGDFKNRSFTFQNNILTKSTASTAGAAIRIQNNSSIYKQEIIRLSNNTFNNLTAGNNGGILSFEGNLSDSLVFSVNDLNSIRTTGSDSTGGALFLKNGTNLNTIEIANNTANTILSNAGGGAFIKYNGKKISSANLYKNQFSDVKSKFTGAYDFVFDSLISCTSKCNKYLNIDGENGALYYFKGGESAYIKSISLLNDTLNKSYATQNGGGVYFDLPIVDTANFENLQIDDADAFINGGFVTGIEGIVIDEFKITNALIDGCDAGNNGGVAALNGKFGNINVSKSNFTNETAANSGGSFYIKGNTQGNLWVSDSRFVNSCGFSIDEITGDGGALYVESIQQCSVSNSSLKVLNVKNNGGAILAKNINNFQIVNCILSENGATYENGGALNVEKISLFTSLNNKYNHNRASHLSGGMGGGLFAKDCNISMKNDSVVGNVAFRGGGAYLELSGGTIDSSYFAHNHIPDNMNNTSWGGGLFVDRNEGKTIEIKDSRIYDNRAYFGGGIYLADASTRFVRNIFDYNGTTGNGEGAAAFFDNSPNTKLYNCIFHANNVARNASQTILPTAGIHMYFNEIGEDTTEIINCAFRSNNAYALGISANSAIPTEHFNKTIVRNSILYYNGYESEDIPQFIGDEDLYKFDFSCVEDIDRKKFGFSNIASLPLFVSDDGYCLKEELSPCINKGDSLAIYNDKIDLNGLRNDMGVVGGPYMFLECEATIAGPDPEWFAIDTVCTKTFSTKMMGDEFLLYPNPSNGQIFIAPGNTFSGNITLKLISYNGSVMLIKQIANEFVGDNFEVDLSGLPKGMYLIQLSDNKKRVVKKIVLM